MVVHYVLDIAEIPTFQIMRERSSDGKWNAKQLQVWADAQRSFVARNIDLQLDGNPLPISGGIARARLRPGAGGLPILYWTGDFAVAISPGSHQVALRDHVYEDRRIGWKDIIVAPAQTEPTHELQVYPSALIGTPATNTAIRFHLAADGGVSAIQRDETATAQQASSPSIVAQTALSQMFLRTDQGPWWILITIFAAFGFGALHAIEPGHGKALLAFTLVGARATRQQAAILAASLTFAHTIGVLILGLVLFFVAGFVPETIYPWITLVSGVVIAIVGGRALARYIRGLAPFAHAHEHAHPHAHPHEHAHEHGSVHFHGSDAHSHGHDHAHDIAHSHSHDQAAENLTHSHGGSTHTHVIGGERPLNFGSAIWAALSGGVAPCPAAIILLIAAVNSHRIGYGLLLIVIFGLGLASVLTGLGLAVVHGAAWISRNEKYERYVRFGPLASAALISIIGSVLLGQGFVQIGAHTNVFIVAALSVAAIAGYALTSRHSHARAVQAI